ncbi:uncharacterized protein BCR38DRAFT_409864 [Pseudomassariella vexata]|uniref:Glucose-methanol-choline oxidoreductase N-terminal domain-containing protein n=1 Tax=Pseudomassariella vexata TaxID=1141098 RepID=A0A1Y2DZ49_9PEZI|nr:uncharacterized protein BCR38DRAFT_409864 [Pseudomassariella vexata]ORY64507.1 hypothetical protein BCR38DRAFT_409864 [Pseudomassariella vexata]
MRQPFPMREKQLESWCELGVSPVPHLDANARHLLGVGELNENKHNGRREIASAVYPLGGVTVLTVTMVQKVLLHPAGQNATRRASGVQLVNGTQLFGREIILSPGAIRTPQIRMLSGSASRFKSTRQRLGETVVITLGLFLFPFPSSCYHVIGPAAMGKVVDTNLRVEGVAGLRGRFHVFRGRIRSHAGGDWLEDENLG